MEETSSQKKNWRRKRTPAWVTKTDIMRVRRCAYAFWLIDTGQVDLDALMPKDQREAVQRGISFESDILSSVPELPPETTLEEAFKLPGSVLGLPLLENSELQIYGIPDGVDASRGRLIPIEIKGRPYGPFRSDRIELAFYWLLLEPYRTRKAKSPQGRLILQSDGESREVKVDLSREDFETVHGLIERVRGIRKDGAQPRLCQCVVCASRPEIQDRLRLFDVIGVGSTRANQLIELGITSLSALRDTDPLELIRRWPARRPGRASVLRWQKHAHALISGEVVRVGIGSFGYPKDFIVLDLEYEPGGDIWLFGLKIFTDGQAETMQLWTDRKDERRRAIKQVERAILSRPTHKVITWSGSTADIPALVGASEGIAGGVFRLILEAQHVDLYRFAERNFRFPCSSLGIKDVSDHFKVERISTVSDGFEAQGLYREYRTTRDKEAKARIRTELLAYNRDDLDSLVEVIRHIAELSLTSLSCLGSQDQDCI